MEIFRSSNTFSPIGTNLSRTDCTFHIFNKIKDTFTEIVVKDQKCGRNACTCQKEIKMHFMIDSQPIIPPSAQNNLISPAPIIPKAKRIIRNNGITLPIIKKSNSRNILLPYTDKQSHRHGKNNPSVINFCCTDIHDHGNPGNRYRKKVKKCILHHLQSYTFRNCFDTVHTIGNSQSLLWYFKKIKVELTAELTGLNHQKNSGEYYYRTGQSICPVLFFVEFLKYL